MKKIIFCLCLISGFYTTAQTTIYEEKDSKQYLYYKSTLLPNSNSVLIGKNIYDENGNKKPLSNTDFNKDFLAISNSENSFFNVDRSKGAFNQKCMYIIDGKIIEINYAEVKDSNIQMFEKNQNFTSKYEYNLVNNKGKFKLNFLKDDIYLAVKDIVTRKKNIYKIDKPNLDMYIGSNFISVKEEFRFDLRVNYDETIDLISKSISKDYSNTILYKTRLSNEGKNLNNLVYDLKIPNRVFLYSKNDAGEYNFGGYNNDFIHFADDLSINNYIEDANTGDIYIYGLFGDEAGKLNTMASPKGFYIFKYDKLGNKTWESINAIEDNDFNKGHVMNTIYVDLFQLNNTVCFTIRINGLKDFFNYNIVEKATGKMVKTQNLEFKDVFAHLNETNNNDFHINKDFKNLQQLKNTTFDFNAVAAYNYNSEVAKYINSIKSDNKTYFSAHFSDKGIWLNESVENEYFKITLFKQ
ncbi:opioid growth factor receptor-related protein [Flavobacterium limi]|uniref:Opioid growth factor receptor (OGFr) conserved domain-containing protein n=1 Tax=Flavobacterium limi TaxID=2045105 RepID=A0ABQ1TQV1_9FLAO|nr:opioid growth factor receptor-related protein [Flavobacterium limi]GGE98845.1 hypothetical protein GCM10011518_05320 [Flavobacterium limi]